MSIYNTAVTALRSANVAIATAGHNIANVNTPGYRRQEAVLATNIPIHSGAGFIGQGANTSTVRRIYSGFLEQQVFQSEAQLAYMQRGVTTLNQIDSLLGDRAAGLSQAVQRFFAAWNSLANDPAATPARQGVLTAANSLSHAINTYGEHFRTLQSGANAEIQSLVTRINAYAAHIADLNQQISALQSSALQTPNDLLDQRDEALSQLNRLTGVTMVPNEKGDYNVFVAGHALVLGGTVGQLSAAPSRYDPTRIEVYAGVSGAQLSIPGRLGGELGAIVDFRGRQLDPAQNALGRIALSLSSAVNTLHANGRDLNGALGALFFNNLTTSPQAFASSANTGTGSLSASVVDSALLTTSDYLLTYDGTNYRLQRLADGTSWSNTSMSGLSALVAASEGFNLSLGGAMAVGDSFLLRPTAAASYSMGVAITDPARIAAAGNSAPPGGILDNTTALAIAALQQDRTMIRGNNTFESAYALWVGEIGSAAAATKASKTLYDNMLRQAEAAQQSVSGVNLDEEAANLIRFQQAYQAAAQLIRTANTIFDTLLAIGR